MNLYERAIYEVCAVLKHYSYDHKFHLLGFGGAPQYLDDPAENGLNSRCWHLDGKPKNAETVFTSKIDGTMEMLATYRHAATNTRFMGPSYLA